MEPCQAEPQEMFGGFKHRSSLGIWMSREPRIFGAMFPSDLRVWMVFGIYNQQVIFGLPSRS